MCIRDRSKPKKEDEPAYMIRDIVERQFKRQSEPSVIPCPFRQMNVADANAIEVVAVDGCFFCMRKSVFDKIRFDEINYKGFHFYDLDISLQVYMLGLKSLCVYDILIEHVSNSKLDNEWLTNARIFFTKWKDCLPIVNYPVSAKERRVLEKNNLQTMNYIINENNRKPSRYYKFSEKLYLLRYCCDKKMLQSLIY